MRSTGKPSIAVGEGGILSQFLHAPAPDAFGKSTRRLCQGLHAAGQALRADQPIPAEVLTRIARPVISYSLYTLLASIH